MNNLSRSNITAERHPLEPFLPEGARVLMLGSFPPKRERWSMEFFYPNFINDMWRIMGLIFFKDKNCFVDGSARRFDRSRIIEFCTNRAIALYDTAVAVRRLKDNASDKFLEVVETTDIGTLLRRIPDCRAIVVTGEKAAETVFCSLGKQALAYPKIGGYVEFDFESRKMQLWRMPSSSRAYPLALEKKAEYYARMFAATGVL